MNGIGVGGYHAIPRNTKQYRAKYNEWHRCWGLGTAGASSRFRWPRLTTAHLINGRAGLKLVRDPDFDLRSGPTARFPDSQLSRTMGRRMSLREAGFHSKFRS